MPIDALVGVKILALECCSCICAIEQNVDWELGRLQVKQLLLVLSESPLNWHI